MNKNQRKNRPKKKEVSPDKWNEQLENLRKQYEYSSRNDDKCKDNNKQ